MNAALESLTVPATSPSEAAPRRRAASRIGAVLRLLPVEMRGKARLARFLLGWAPGESVTEVHDRYGNVLKIASIKETVGFNLLINGVYGAAETRFILNHLTLGATFLDVGANIGCYSLPAAKKVGPTGQVLAVEASPRIVTFLHDNIQRNGLNNVTVLSIAAWDRSGMVPFYAAPVRHAGMGSLAPRFGDGPILVPARRLDDVLAEIRIDRVDVMKVDVEGFEAAVFRGTSNLLTSTAPPLVLFELNDWAETQAGFEVGAAQRVLRDWGYHVWRLEDYQRGRRCLDAPITVGSAMLVAEHR